MDKTKSTKTYSYIFKNNFGLSITITAKNIRQANRQLHAFLLFLKAAPIKPLMGEELKLKLSTIIQLF